jgi:hypothetical protein
MYGNHNVAGGKFGAACLGKRRGQRAGAGLETIAGEVCNARDGAADRHRMSFRVVASVAAGKTIVVPAIAGRSGAIGLDRPFGTVRCVTFISRIARLRERRRLSLPRHEYLRSYSAQFVSALSKRSRP